ncbi:hypothetical protein GCM10020227_25950 [Streptomyces flavovirens]
MRFSEHTPGPPARGGTVRQGAAGKVRDHAGDGADPPGRTMLLVRRTALQGPRGDRACGAEGHLRQGPGSTLGQGRPALVRGARGMRPRVRAHRSPGPPGPWVPRRRLP